MTNCRRKQDWYHGGLHALHPPLCRPFASLIFVLVRIDSRDGVRNGDIITLIFEEFSKWQPTRKKWGGGERRNTWRWILEEKNLPYIDECTDFPNSRKSVFIKKSNSKFSSSLFYFNFGFILRFIYLYFESEQNNWQLEQN